MVSRSIAPPSAIPQDHAMPALVVAMAGNPTCSRMRAEPASHALGSTKPGPACSASRAAALSVDEPVGTAPSWWMAASRDTLAPLRKGIEGKVCDGATERGGIVMSRVQLYDTIGATYNATRRTDPRIAARIWAALGDARTVLNVGAGTGSYEPSDRQVVAVEPSALMRSQRPPDAAPCVAGSAENLPFADRAFD